MCRGARSVSFVERLEQMLERESADAARRRQLQLLQLSPEKKAYSSPYSVLALTASALEIVRLRNKLLQALYGAVLYVSPRCTF